MSDSDALERLRSKNRNRPTVPNRDTSLAPISDISDTLMSRHLDSQTAESLDVSEPNSQDSFQSLQTKRGTVRLEAEISDRLHALCRKNGICREVLIEAMFEYCESDSEVLQTVLDEAKKKNQYRQQIANQKQAKSMIEGFG